MKLEMTNLESIKAFRDAQVVNDKVYIISHAPYDVFEQTISFLYYTIYWLFTLIKFQCIWRCSYAT